MFLDQTSGQPDLNLGDVATINTDTGAVTVGGAAVNVKSDTRAQSGAPTIRVFMVRSLTADKVSVTGTNALAIVSNGEIRLNDLFDLSAKGTTAGSGAFDDGTCVGKATAIVPNRQYRGGTGGGGFGSPGGRGGEGRTSQGHDDGGAGGTPSGIPQLTPLRGGCSGGGASGGRGGGALQLVSRSQIVVGGIIATNGSSYFTAGSGGGILLEAPIVDVAGRVVANGASAGIENSGDCKPGQNGRLDAQPALGSPSCGQFILLTGSGGNGAALNIEATNGGDAFFGNALVFGGNGGGGVGRVRINTAPGGQRGSGVFSPNPTHGALTTR